mmetsp:Transcript_13439/g.39724  ORF Transcript_13439/g.39724 Transcript_13439/m.39724 type:complete len:300 (+) Transcript_13439:276-1175(+)
MPSLGRGLSEGLSMGMGTLPKQWAGGLTSLQWSKLAGSTDGAADAPSAEEPAGGGGGAAAAGGKGAEAGGEPSEPPRPLTEEEQLEVFLKAGAYDKAAAYAANSPKQELRTLQTVQRFQGLPAAAGGQPPILLYFGALLRRSGALKTAEALELARGVCGQGQVGMVAKWVADGKVEQSEALADIVREKDPAAAVPIYAAAGAPRKVLRCHAELVDIDEVVHLGNSQEPPAKADWGALLAEILGLPGGVPRAIALEEALRALPPPPPPPDPTDSLAVMTYNMDMLHTPPPPPEEAEDYEE